MSDAINTARLRAHVGLLARCTTVISLVAWNEVSNDILSAADMLDAQTARIKELEERLEINHAYQLIDGKMQRVEMDVSPYDGITCRNETIRLQDERIAQQAARIAALREALRAYMEADATDNMFRIPMFIKAERLARRALEGGRDDR